jgi:hypothetical protein
VGLINHLNAPSYKIHIMVKKIIPNDMNLKNSDSDEDSDDNCSNGVTSEDDSNAINNEVIDPVKFFAVKELCYYKTVDKFFKNCSEENISTMIEIINKKSHVSLRTLDWFVTKYSKRRIDCGINKNCEIFDVRISYKSQLKSYKKKYFDPFRRRKKFVYEFKDSENRKVFTTLGQLNFFKWVFLNNILEYVKTHLKHITKEMNIANKEDKKRKKLKLDCDNKEKDSESSSSTSNDKKKHPKKNKKDSDLKINATKFSVNDEMKITLKFD